MSNQVSEAAGQRERIDAYLDRSGLARQSPRVLSLTGDASDRRYYRVMVPDSPSSPSPDQTASTSGVR